MKRKSRMIVIIAVAVICISLISSVFWENSITDKMAKSISIVSAIIGAVAIFLQFKRDKLVNVSSFLMELNKQVLENEHFTDIDRKLEFEHQFNKDYLSLEEDKYWVVNFLSWHEGLCSIVNDGALSIKDVDTLFGYRFFMLMNNHNIWSIELEKELAFYPAICQLYPHWYKYRECHGEFIINDDTNILKQCTDISSQIENNYKGNNKKKKVIKKRTPFESKEIYTKKPST